LESIVMVFEVFVSIEILNTAFPLICIAAMFESEKDFCVLFCAKALNPRNKMTTYNKYFIINSILD